MASNECGIFSEDGRLFGYCGVDGKLKIWDPVAGTLIQEYTPNLHLASPCTCLSWLRTSKSLLSGKPPPKKKKARLSGQGSVDVVGMGLASGNILLYSTAVGEVVCQLQGGHTGTVNHLAWSRGANLFSCGDDGHVVEWTLHDSAVSSKWKADNGRVTCVLVLPEGETLLSASQTIRWWDLKSKQLLRSFVGHTSHVVSLTLVAPPGRSNTDSMYFLSASRDDRFVSAWSLNQGKDCVATFATEDAARSVSVVFGEGEQSSVLAAVTNTGTLHMFRHQLNGKRLKPLKPECTVTVSVEDKKQKETVQSVPIIAANISNSQEILIVYGSPALLTFEKIPASHSDKVVRLVRQTSRRKSASKQSDVSKVMVPIVGDDVEFVTSAGPSNAPKRSRTALEVPLEERLNNLTVSKLDKTTGVPKPDSMTQLLVQGLNSKDKKMMQNVLFTSDERLIRNTVSRLPGQYVMSLVKELTTRMLGRTYMPACWCPTRRWRRFWRRCRACWRDG
ncbi:WD repeat-containing protein 43 isoform X2 [Bacillus rossius redtenbacheri]|uniref:WD repeat-containing protein 43 isoform X2 n=1 Tax=Bacillus rossius redtenbacheri TaxID=93214 RepID=UPI002FDEA929